VIEKLSEIGIRWVKSKVSDSLKRSSPSGKLILEDLNLLSGHWMLICKLKNILSDH